MFWRIFFEALLVITVIIAVAWLASRKIDIEE
jgi:hypothetical protein